MFLDWWFCDDSSGSNRSSISRYHTYSWTPYCEDAQTRGGEGTDMGCTTTTQKTFKGKFTVDMISAHNQHWATCVDDRI